MCEMKIAIVTGKFPTVSETFIVNQILYLKNTGHTVDVFCFKKGEPINQHHTGSLSEQVQLLGHKNLIPNNYVFRLLLVGSILFRTLFTSLFFRLLKALFLKKGKLFNTDTFFRTYYLWYFNFHRYDVLHIHFGNHAVLLLEQLKIFKNKIIVSFHGFDAHNYDQEFYRALLQLKNIQYIVNTDFVKSKVLNLGFDPYKISILPVSLDTSYFIPEKTAHTDSNILFVGRFIELKAPLLAIKIVEKLIQETDSVIHFNLIGEGQDYNSCLEYVQKHNLSGHITLHGARSQHEVKDIMNLSDIFLFPGIVDHAGRCEAQGLVLQEAQAMELPVIISDVGGMKEGVLDGKTGHVIKAGDVDGFVRCLKSFIDDPTKQKHMGKAARSFVVAHYDSTILGHKLLNLYRDA